MLSEATTIVAAVFVVAGAAGAAVVVVGFVEVCPAPLSEPAPQAVTTASEPAIKVRRATARRNGRTEAIARPSI
ncbi:MAG: hypothetical protein R3E83_19305 [Burkholderiaceae bacterium]